MSEDVTRTIEERLELQPALKRRPERMRLVDRMGKLGVPGVTVAVIDRGEIVWAGGYGLRRVEGTLPMEADTMLQAGSISKPVTAMAVMRCVEDGILDLDRDVNEYLTSWKVPANGDWQPRVTLRQLLSHTAGLTVHGFPGYNRRGPIPTVPQVLDGAPPANTPPVRVNLIPGTQHRYSGGGTTVVQLLLTDVLGKPFPRIMKDMVLDPLEMHHSTYEQPLPERFWDRAAWGYRAGGGPVEGGWHVYPEMAAAGLWTTAIDLAKLAIDMQRAWADKPGTLLGGATVREMLKAQVDRQIGIGFFLEGGDDSARFGHGGSDEGFMAQVVAYKTRTSGAAAMSNSDYGMPLIDNLMRTIAREYGWPEYPETVQDIVALAPEATARFTGSFRLDTGLTIKVMQDGDALWVQAPDQPPFRLQPVGEAAFVSDVVNTEFVFVGDGGGSASCLELRQDGVVLPAERME